MTAPAVKEGAISGTVVDADGNLVPEASIRLSSDASRTVLEVRSDAAGAFRFDNVPPGSFLLTVRAPGFAPVEVKGVAEPGKALEYSALKLTTPTAQFEVSALSSYEIAEIELKHEEHQRLLGVLPNFGISYDWNAPALSAGQKYRLATRFVVDPTSFAIAGIQAGAEQAANVFPGYGPGPAGFAKRYGAAFADFALANELAGAVFPAVFHQDPRYFWKGTGGWRARTWYAIESAVICRGDNGHDQFNYSGIGGALAAGAISNLYYPKQNRNGASLMFENAGIGLGANAIGNIVQEFLLKKVTPNSARLPANTSGVAGGAITASSRARKVRLQVHP